MGLGEAGFGEIGLAGVERPVEVCFGVAEFVPFGEAGGVHYRHIIGVGLPLPFFVAPG